MPATLRFPRIAAPVAALTVAAGLLLAPAVAATASTAPSGSIAATVKRAVIARKLPSGRVKVTVRTTATRVGFRVTTVTGAGKQSSAKVKRGVVTRGFPKTTVRVAWNRKPAATRGWRVAWETPAANTIPDPWKKTKPNPDDGDPNPDDGNETPGDAPTGPPWKYGDHIAPGCGSATGYSDPELCTEFFYDEWSCLMPEYRDEGTWRETYCEPGDNVDPAYEHSATLSRCVEQPGVGVLMEITYTIPTDNSRFGKYGRHDIHSYGIKPGSAKVAPDGESLTYETVDNLVTGNTTTITLPYAALQKAYWGPLPNSEPFVEKIHLGDYHSEDWSGVPLMSWENREMYKRPVNYEQVHLGLPEGTTRSIGAVDTWQHRTTDHYGVGLTPFELNAKDQCASLGETQVWSS